MQSAVPSRLLPLFLVAFALALPLTAGAEGDETTWKEARKEAGRLMKVPGELPRKAKAIHCIARDDSERSAELLVKWAAASLKLHAKDLHVALDDAQVRFDKLIKILRKAYAKMPPTRKEDRDAYDIKRKALDRARADYEAETSLHRHLARAFSKLTDPEAIDFLLAKGERKVTKSPNAGPILMGILECYVRQPRDRVRARLLQHVRCGQLPEARIRILNWIANEKPGEEAFQAAVTCLAGPEEAVRRSAVFTLRILDDPRCVKALIDALAAADGLLEEEIDHTLHYFTGRSFDGSHAVWTQWWDAAGETWLATDDGERYAKKPGSRQKGGTTSFYGVETRSKRIVFVLDRSSSMKTPASAESRCPRGPTSGDGSGKDGEPDIQGDTKIAVARNQLAWSIRNLHRDVHFNVIFYSTDVQVWKQPPEMLRATPKNKTAALDWFMTIEALGTTRTFDALLQALEYAKGAGGADTIFLLSDGSPTVASGQALKGEDFDREYGAFLEENKIYKCVVHTIGVGPHHNRTLMRRIARDTGGTYRGVGD